MPVVFSYMLTLDTVMLLISASALFSLRFMQGRFRPIEKLVYYMVITTTIQQMHSAILLNFQLITFWKDIPAVAFYKMNQLIVFPISTLWLLFLFFHPTLHILFKMLFSGIWLTVLSLVYPLFQGLGIFKLTGWNYGYSIVIWYIVLLESLCFSLLFRTMLGKGESHDSVSP